MPFCSSCIYKNITIEIFVKVNITPTPTRSNKVGNDLDLAPLPGLQNDTDIQYSEDTKLKRSQTILLYVSQVVGNRLSRYNRPTNRHAQSNMLHLLRMRAYRNHDFHKNTYFDIKSVAKSLV